MSPQSPLGREVTHPRKYDSSLLFAIARAQGRATLGLHGGALPFAGFDRWHAYELSWLDLRGKPQVATATITVPADSPNLIESKSLKLYLNAFSSHRIDELDAVLAIIAADLSRTAGAAVAVRAGLPAIEPGPSTANGGTTDADTTDAASCDAASIDNEDIAIDDYGPPSPAHLVASPDALVEETLRSALLKSNCPVTGQPDWASVRIGYRGPRIERAGLLRYLVSFREHAEFHEQCVERIFVDLMARCRPQSLWVEARYTRRGGLDINPWRATPGHRAPAPGRDLRQ